MLQKKKTGSNLILLSLIGDNHHSLFSVYQKRKVWRTLANVMSFLLTRSLLPLPWCSQSLHSETSCFLSYSRLEPQLRIAHHSCCGVHSLFICCFLLYMHETDSYTFSETFLNRLTAVLFSVQATKRHCLE